MIDLQDLLARAKEVAQEAVLALANVAPSLSSCRFADDLPREMKATADLLLDEIVVRGLRPTGLPILSEEAGALGGTVDTDLRWVIDPLDGTVNFTRGIAPCAVSIALCREGQPIFGVIGEYPSFNLAWGGRSLGEYLQGRPIQVSTIADKSKGVLCTGFPSRFDFSGSFPSAYVKLMNAYGKVRMLGAASLSLLQVAKGAADMYLEHDIMIWDVAAGLALVEGAGGSVRVTEGRHKYSHNITASNGLLQFD